MIMLLPSNGGMGNMLKIAKLILYNTMSRNTVYSASEVSRFAASRPIIKQYAINAIITFDVGPERATNSSSVRRSLKAAILIGTGLAQPKPMRNMARAPTASICAIGFNVKRPARRGVGSPSQVAIRAWAYSCPAMAKMSAGTPARKPMISKLNIKIHLYLCASN